MIWNEAMETLSRRELEELQGERLSALAKRVYDRVPFYKAQFDAVKLDPNRIKSLDDLQRLPESLLIFL